MPPLKLRRKPLSFKAKPLTKYSKPQLPQSFHLILDIITILLNPFDSALSRVVAHAEPAPAKISSFR